MTNRISNGVKYILLLFTLAFLASPVLVSAEDKAMQVLKDIGSDKGPFQDISAGGEFGLTAVIGAVIQGALALIGVIFLALMLYAGYHWMTARGEEEKVEKAKDTIQRAIVGIIIVVGAYAIWLFIFNQLF